MNWIELVHAREGGLSRGFPNVHQHAPMNARALCDLGPSAAVDFINQHPVLCPDANLRWSAPARRYSLTPRPLVADLNGGLEGASIPRL